VIRHTAQQHTDKTIMKFTSICCGIAALFALGLSNAGATPFTQSAGDVPVVIDDLGTGTSVINVTDHGRVIDINALVNITHGWDGDLVLTLSHNGTTVVLSNRNGGSGGANYENTLFDDGAYTAINAGYAYAPYAGAFRPEQALAAFVNQDIFGDWIFSATDMEAGDAGVINSFSLSGEVPEPASLALFGLGMMGLARIRRRK
jgi:subtilisin-like proprotein convertase family protein